MNPAGLLNLGNTCYANSFMQILAHLPELNTFLTKLDMDDAMKDICKTVHKDFPFHIISEWNDLRKIMQSTSQTVRPAKFMNIVYEFAKRANSELCTPRQHDVTELITFMLDEFHTNVSRPHNPPAHIHSFQPTTSHVDKLVQDFVTKLFDKEYSEIWTTFFGIQIASIKKQHGNNQPTVSNTMEYHSTISLPISTTHTSVGGNVAAAAADTNTQNTMSIYDSIGKSTTLYHCIESYIAPEHIDNVVSDDGSNKSVNCEKQINFWNFPPVLIICLKRFCMNMNGVLYKNHTNVIFDNEIDLSKYAIGTHRGNDTYKYELHGVCNHIGGMNGGHYTAAVKCDGQWTMFDDDTVHHISDDDMAKCVHSPSAYCIVYRKKT